MRGHDSPRSVHRSSGMHAEASRAAERGHKRGGSNVSVVSRRRGVRERRRVDNEVRMRAQQKRAVEVSETEAGIQRDTHQMPERASARRGGTDEPFPARRHAQLRDRHDERTRPAKNEGQPTSAVQKLTISSPPPRAHSGTLLNPLSNPSLGAQGAMRGPGGANRETLVRGAGQLCGAA